MCTRGHWRPAEDDKLRELVERHGPHNWNAIAEKLQGRSGKSCRLRWFNQLDPRINRSPFTEEEEERLLASHRIHGNRWSIIARHFPGRTDNAVKNHWHVIMARRCRERSRIYARRSAAQTLMMNRDNLQQKMNCETSNSASFVIEKNSTAEGSKCPFTHNLSSRNFLGLHSDHLIHHMNMDEDRRHKVEFYDFLQINTDSINGSSEVIDQSIRRDEEEVEQELEIIDQHQHRHRHSTNVTVPFMEFLSVRGSS